MSRFEDRWELPLLAVTAALGLLAAGTLMSSGQYIKRISASAENNVVYEVMTTSPELARLQAAIAGRFLPGSTITDDDVALRFAIIENRMKVLGTAESRRLRQDSSEATELIERMQSVVLAVTPQISQLNAAADAAGILAVFEPLNRQATRLAALTTSQAANRIADNEQKLVDIFWMLLADISGLLGCGVLLIVLLRRARRKAHHSAATDVLTGLPNRLSFNTVLASEFAGGAPSGTLAVLMFDLDFFKDVNDTLGHAAGDELLRSVADRLTPLLSCALLFARLGGDEFAAIIRADDAETVAEETARRILVAFAMPFPVARQLVTSGTSIGIAPSGARDRQPEDLLKNADLALYAAKGNERGGFRVYQPSLKTAYLERQTLSKDLEQALARKELELYFQPIVAVGSGRTTGFEALLRWRHPSRGWVLPSAFIPIAEETGLILPIGRWVIGQACATAAGWPEEIGIAINLSARQFVDPDLKATVLDAVTTHRLSAGRVTLEITESALIQNDQSVLATLNDLRAVGVKIALDDFGTGYASLGYLTRFPFDEIKIDQSFVRGSPEHDNSTTIVHAICDLATKLGMSTVAEGVETEAQIAMVQAAGCGHAQGYLFDRPMPAAQCAQRLAREIIQRPAIPPFRLGSVGCGDNVRN